MSAAAAGTGRAALPSPSTERTLAATWTLGGAPAAASGRPLAALAAEGPAREARRGGLELAWTGGEAALTPDALCAIDGAIDDLDALAASVGADPAAGAEQVVLHAYARLGAGLLERLRGDFALVLAGPRGGLVARDPSGARGLHWRRDGDRLHVASEPALLAALSGRAAEPDHGAIAVWLISEPLPADRTLLAGVRRLRCGEALLVDGGGTLSSTRFQVPRYRPPARRSRAESAALLREGVLRLVGRRLDPAGPTGLLLSGGLDSTAIAAAALHERAGSVRGYSGGFPAFGYTDESARVDAFAAASGIAGARTIAGGEGLLSGTLAHIERWGMPSVGWSDFWEQPLLRRAAADGVGRVLHGEGGDELFGARVQLLADRLRSGRLPSLLRLGRQLEGLDGLRGPVTREYASSTLRAALPGPLHERLRRRRQALPLGLEHLSAAAAAAVLEADDPWAWKRLDGPAWWSRPTHSLTEHVDANGVLDHVRRRARWAGLATRSPFLGRDALELVLGLPPEHSFGHASDRPLLREALAGVLAEQQRRRTGKAYFNTMVLANLAADLPAIAALVQAPDAQVRPWVDRAGLDALLSGGPHAHPAHPFTWAQQVLRLATVECWLRELAAPGSVARLRERGTFRPAGVTLAALPAA